MGFFDFFKRPDINQGIAQYQDTEGAVLIDVRTPEEYAGGHIPGSKNIPLQNIHQTTAKIKDKNTPLFVYCLSGARSSKAVSSLVSMGYTAVTNIGGIGAYHGRLE